jgi:hypothetical protein
VAAPFGASVVRAQVVGRDVTGVRTSVVRGSRVGSRRGTSGSIE